jgi:hypothetical protein
MTCNWTCSYICCMSAPGVWLAIWFYSGCPNVRVPVWENRSTILAVWSRTSFTKLANCCCTCCTSKPWFIVPTTTATTIIIIIIDWCNLRHIACCDWNDNASQINTSINVVVLWLHVFWLEFLFFIQLTSWT